MIHGFILKIFEKQFMSGESEDELKDDFAKIKYESPTDRQLQLNIRYRGFSVQGNTAACRQDIRAGRTQGKDGRGVRSILRLHGQQQRALARGGPRRRQQPKPQFRLFHSHKQHVSTFGVEGRQRPVIRLGQADRQRTALSGKVLDERTLVLLPEMGEDLGAGADARTPGPVGAVH